MVHDVAERLAGRAAVVQVNTDEAPQLSVRFGIRGVPALVILRRGEVVASRSGARPAAEIVDWFIASLGKG